MGRAFEFRKGRKMKRWSAMAKTFTRIGKDIVMAVKEGGPNPEANSRLRAVIQNAKAANMPKDNVERAIKNASNKDTANYKEILFEGYAPHGIAVLIETASDNNNRTVANIRSYFNKCNGTFGTQGSPHGATLVDARRTRGMVGPRRVGGVLVAGPAVHAGHHAHHHLGGDHLPAPGPGAPRVGPAPCRVALLPLLAVGGHRHDH